MPCDEGRTCSIGNDCWSGKCQSGVCVGDCTNGVKDGDESDIDCGGSCTDCFDGRTCNAASDCFSNTCTSGVCKSPLVATLNVNSDWQTGFCGGINLQNTASTPTRTWTLEAKFADSTFTSTSGALFTSQGSGIYRLTPASWNATIWPSSNSTVSFCTNKTGPNYHPLINWVRPQY